MIQVTIDGKGYEYPENCSYYEIAKDFEKTMDAPIVLVKVDGRLRELHKQLKKLKHSCAILEEHLHPVMQVCC